MGAGYGYTLPYGSGNYKQDLYSLDAAPRTNKVNYLTGLCLRYAVKTDQGQGWSFYENGNSWVWPMTLTDTVTVYDDKEQPRYLVLDETTGHFYEIGTRDGAALGGLEAIYLDKQDPYGGAEIPWLVKFKEHTGDIEHKKIELFECHLRLRPQEPENLGDAAYSASGYRLAQVIKIQAYVDGNQTKLMEIDNIPIDADLIPDRKTEGNRIMIEASGTASELKIVGFDAYYNMKDEATSRKMMNQYDCQLALANPILWLTRGFNPVLDRADGVNFTGSYFGVITGPDSKDSALSFGVADGLNRTMPTMAGDYTAILGLTDIYVDTSALVFTNLTMRIEIAGGVYYLRYNDGTHNFLQALTWTGTGWVELMVTRSGNVLTISENGVLLNTMILTNILTHGGLVQAMTNFAGSLFDLRFYNSALNENTFLYYYKDITENGGDNTCPMV